MTPTLSIILPCRNEKETIGMSIQKIKQVARAHTLSIEIIVSDSSSDGSHEIAQKEGVMVIKHDTEGYGFAIREGARYANGHVLLFADVDGTYDFEDIPRFVEALRHADIIMGSRMWGKIEKGAMPILHRICGTPLFNILLFIFFGIRVSDSQTGYRAMYKKTFFALDLKTKGMEFATEIIIKAKKHGYTIKEIPVNYFQRKGISKLRRYRDGWAHLKYIIMCVPSLFYIGIGGGGVALGLMSLSLGNVIHPLFTHATTKIFLPIGGMQILFLGLFVKTYFAIEFEEKNETLEKFYRIFHLSYALAFGGICILLAISMKIAGIADIYFDIALVSTILGFQIIFNSIALSALSIH